MPRTVGCADMGEAGGRAGGLWMVVHGCLFPCAVVFRMGLARDRGVVGLDDGGGLFTDVVVRRLDGLLCGLLIGEHLLLDQHAVGLRRVLLLGHGHAFLVAQLVSVREHELLDLLGELHELVLFEDRHGDGVRAARRIAEHEARAHGVREVRGRDQQQDDRDGHAGLEASERDEQPDQSPDEAAEVEFRARVHARDVAQRDGLRVRPQRDQAEQGVRAFVLDAGRACGDAGLEPEDDHAGTETVPDDVLLAWCEGEFGHGLLCLGHSFSPWTCVSWRGTRPDSRAGPRRAGGMRRAARTVSRNESLLVGWRRQCPDRWPDVPPSHSHSPPPIFVWGYKRAVCPSSLTGARHIRTSEIGVRVSPIRNASRLSGIRSAGRTDPVPEA